MLSNRELRTKASRAYDDVKNKYGEENLELVERILLLASSAT